MQMLAVAQSMVVVVAVQKMVPQQLFLVVAHCMVLGVVVLVELLEQQ
jgi:hypothetical protein